MLRQHRGDCGGRARLRLLLTAPTYAVYRAPALARRVGAELLGSALLCAIVIGSGIAAQRLSPGNLGLELLENALATGAGLYVLILVFGPVSGAHFNPLVSAVDALFGGLEWRDVAAYTSAQAAGCTLGALLANEMFGLPAVTISRHHRTSSGHVVAEVVATFGLLLVIMALARTGRSRSVPGAVGAYIGAAYFFTSSTSFANPAITVGRMFSNTFSGIAPASVPQFVLAQVLGAALAVGVIRLLYSGLSRAEASTVLLPHRDGRQLSDEREPALEHPGALGESP